MSDTASNKQIHPRREEKEKASPGKFPLNMANAQKIDS